MQRRKRMRGTQVENPESWVWKEPLIKSSLILNPTTGWSCFRFRFFCKKQKVKCFIQSTPSTSDYSNLVSFVLSNIYIYIYTYVYIYRICVYIYIK